MRTCKAAGAGVVGGGLIGGSPGSKIGIAAMGTAIAGTWPPALTGAAVTGLAAALAARKAADRRRHRPPLRQSQRTPPKEASPTLAVGTDGGMKLADAPPSPAAG